MATVSTNPTYTFTATGNRSLTAVFEAVIPTYTITATIDPAGSGTVTGAGQYQEGETVTLTATVNDGYAFSGWQENGQTVSTDNPYTFAATEDRSLSAVLSESSVLPDGYTRCEYVETTTNIAGFSALGAGRVSHGARIVFDVTPTEQKNMYFYFGLASYSYTKSFLMVKDSSTISCCFGESAIDLPYSVEAGKRIFVDVDPEDETIKINNDVLNFDPGNIPAGENVPIYFPGFYGQDISGLRMKIYSLKIYDSGVLKADLVPCTNESNTPGFFDVVSNAFQYSYYGGAVAGPAA